MESCKCPLHIYSKQHVHPDRKDMVGLLSLRRPFAPPGRQQGLRGRDNFNSKQRATRRSLSSESPSHARSTTMAGPTRKKPKFRTPLERLQGTTMLDGRHHLLGPAPKQLNLPRPRGVSDAGPSVADTTRRTHFESLASPPAMDPCAGSLHMKCCTMTAHAGQLRSLPRPPVRPSTGC